MPVVWNFWEDGDVIGTKWSQQKFQEMWIVIIYINTKHAHLLHGWNIYLHVCYKFTVNGDTFSPCMEQMGKLKNCVGISHTKPRRSKFRNGGDSNLWYPPWNWHSTWKWMFGILASFRDGLFSWAMLVSGSVLVFLRGYPCVQISEVSLVSPEVVSFTDLPRIPSNWRRLRASCLTHHFGGWLEIQDGLKVFVLHGVSEDARENQ